MTERPHSQYTRDKTWAALYSQHINAGYALVPLSVTNNSIDVVRCASADEVIQTMKNLEAYLNDDKHLKECEDYYTRLRAYHNQDTQSAQMIKKPQAPAILAKARQAVVLARSSDYYHYSLGKDQIGFFLVICGLHDSYLQMPVWETRTNKRYGARETAISISSPQFEKARFTQFGHNILVGALINGDKEAIAFMEKLKTKTKTQRTLRRIRSEVRELQDKRYQGRPLTFLSNDKRQEIGSKISAGLKRYHAKGAI